MKKDFKSYPHECHNFLKYGSLIRCYKLCYATYEGEQEKNYTEGVYLDNGCLKIKKVIRDGLDISYNFLNEVIEIPNDNLITLLDENYTQNNRDKKINEILG